MLATDRSRTVMCVGFRHPLWDLGHILHRYLRDVIVKTQDKEEKHSKASWPDPNSEVPGLPIRHGVDQGTGLKAAIKT